MIEIDLKGHVAFITGSSGGLGRSIALKLAEAGAKVAVCYFRNKISADSIVDIILSNQGEAISCQLDVRDYKSVSAAMTDVSVRLGPIDILINNAGKEERIAHSFDMNDADYQQMLDLNLFGLIHTSKAAFTSMRVKNWGRIINIATINLNYPIRGFSAYASGKAAMVGLSRNLAIELGEFGITVNVIAPSWIATEGMKYDSKEDIERLIQQTPLGRQGCAEDIANAVLFFASNLANFISGAYLPVTGAQLL